MLLMKHLLALLFFCSSCLFSEQFCHTIDSYPTFKEYSKEVDGERFTKFALDLREGTIYYFDPKYYTMHYDFVTRALGVSSYEEYLQNYSEQKPRFLFCQLIHHIRQDIWTLTLWEGDKATKEQIELGFFWLEKSFYNASNVLFRPTSTEQELVAKTLSGITVRTNDELFCQGDYQLLHRATSVGYLRIGKTDDFNVDDIVIIKEPLTDITLVAGIITEHFSTPLSHLALRARGWDIPHAGIKDASELFKALDGKCVFFQATPEGYILREATAEEQTLFTHRPHDKVTLSAVNLTETRIAPLRALRAHNFIAYGTKAANLGECTRLNVRIPQGFAVPFYYYKRHLDCCPEKTQEAILATPVDPDLLNTIWRQALSLQTTSLFVRSSTNSEDLYGFTGAGLYETVGNVKDKKGLEEAIKTVWASVYSKKAQTERQHYGINDDDVFSALLIQEGINAASSGVLVTKDIFDPTETMRVYTINASYGLGLSVVEGALIPEQILYNYDNKGIKVLSRVHASHIAIFDPVGGIKKIPNPYNGMPVLTDQEVTALGNASYKLEHLFGFKYPLDIEWLFANDTLYIVQVRPF